MFRKSAVAAALLFISASPDTYALGLGEIDMQSALNQPMSAVIALTSAAGTDLSQIKISLASNEAHQRAGLSRHRFLSKFRFNVESGSNGKPVVRITSTDTVHEPFLEFMLQLEWPNGRLLRQYTVLVDPPVTLPAAPAIPTAPVARTPAPVAAETPRPAVTSPPAVTAPARSVTVPASSPVADSYGPIRRSETLWDIAKRLRPDEGVTMDQMMIALQRANPRAFMNNNINQMQAGVTLRVPDRNEITAVSAREASAESRRQYAEWKAARAAAQQEQAAASAATPAEEPAVPEPDEQATVAEGAAGDAVAPETEAAAAAAGEPVIVTEARLQLTAPEDDLVEGAATAGDPATADAPAADDTDTLSQQLAMVSEEAEANRAQAEELQSRVSELEEQIATMKRLLELKDDELASMQQLAASEPAAAEAAPPVGEQQAAFTEAAPEATDSEEKAEGPMAVVNSIINRLMQNPVLAGLGALAAILLGGILWASLRRRKNQGLFDDEMTFDDHLAETAPEDTSEATPVIADVGEYSEPAREPAVPPQRQDEEAGDPLTEADVYLAYGRIQQAEDILRAALQNNPGDTAARRKLLEVYHQAGNATAFDNLAGELREGLDEEDSEWLEIATMGYELSPGNELYRAVGGGGEPETDFDMDLSGVEEPAGDEPQEENELPETIEFNLDDLETESVSFEDTAEEEPSEGLLDVIDEVTTKLDLARAYIDMGDPEGARSILKEVMEEGSDEQKREADTIISQLA